MASILDVILNNAREHISSRATDAPKGIEKQRKAASKLFQPSLVLQDEEDKEKPYRSASVNSASSEEEPSSNRESPSSPNGTATGSRADKKINFACCECRKAHKACSGGRPCERCVKLGIDDKCQSTVRKKRILTKKYWYNFLSAQLEQGKASDCGKTSPEDLQQSMMGTPVMQSRTATPYMANVSPASMSKLLSTALAQQMPQQFSMQAPMLQPQQNTAGQLLDSLGWNFAAFPQQQQQPNFYPQQQQNFSYQQLLNLQQQAAMAQPQVTNSKKIEVIHLNGTSQVLPSIREIKQEMYHRC